MKRKNGFTLIELLAVIVILAIIALIATPIVLNVINGAKESSVLRSAENYIKAVELKLADESLKDSKYNIEDGSYSVTNTGDICVGIFNENKCKGQVLEIKVEGEKPTGEKIVIENKKIIQATLKYGDKIIEINEEGKLGLASTLEEKYETAKKNNGFLGTYDKYVIEEIYNAELGALVNYEEPSDLGYTGKWRIIGVDNGQIALVSTQIVDSLTLTGIDAWNNGVSKLNKISAKYANGTTGASARSIKIEDLNKLFEYNPKKEISGKTYYEGSDWEYGNKVTYTYKSDGNISYTGSNGITSDKIIEPDGTILTTFRYIDKNGDVVNLSKTGDKLTVTNNFYTYHIRGYQSKDKFENNVNVYGLNSTNVGNPERKGYTEIINVTNSSNTVTSYWLANESAFPLKRGLSYGIRTAYVSSCNNDICTQIGREKLYHSSQDGNVEGQSGAFSATYGVRVIVLLDSNVYLQKKSDGTYDITKTSSKNSYTYVSENTEKTDSYGNKYTVPKGFRVVPELASNVTEGIVIADKDGNEFVWVPTGTIKTATGTKTINIGRYQFSSTGVASTYTGLYVENSDETENFLNSVKKYNGYYISRHEARIDSNGNLSINPNDLVYNTVVRDDALKLSKEMYKENTSYATNLMNSYAWDTAIVFIQTFENALYSQQKATYGTRTLKGTSSLVSNYQDKARNIYDMAGNCWEWTTESNNGVSVFRGGSYDDLTTKNVAHRQSVADAYAMTSFRPDLYLK